MAPSQAGQCPSLRSAVISQTRVTSTDQSEARTQWHWPMRGRGEIWVRALVTRTQWSLPLGTSSREPVSRCWAAAGAAANQRAGMASRERGQPIGGWYWWWVPDPAHPGCVGLSQSVPGPVAARKTAFRSPSRGWRADPDCVSWPRLSRDPHHHHHLCLVTPPESGPGPQSEPRLRDVCDGKQQRVHSEKIFWWTAEILGDSAETRWWV